MINNFINHIPNKDENYVIFDIGSRDCMQSIEFYNAFPNAKIYAFECNPNTIPLCKQNIKNYSDRITLIEGAVCDYDGKITFYPINQEKTITTWKDGNPGASSIFKSNGKYTVEKYVQDEITTNCHRLDTVMQNQNISQVDIIWMDLQGAELLALKGLDKYLDTVKYIFTEVSHQPIYTGQVMFNELNSFIINRGFISKNKLSMQGWQEDIIYENKNINGNNIFDIVIPVGPNDLEIIHKQIDYTKENIIGYRNIYLIYINDSLTVEGCITIVEKLFPFTINTVAEYHGKLERNGWYLQQLLKLYAGFVIPGILDKYLVVDADTFFLKPQLFYQENKCLYNYGYEYHKPYFEHLQRLSPDFHKMNQSLSGICHHMLFETKIVKEIIDIVEKKHGDIFYRIFLKNVTEKSGSGASEYELYFNYILDKHYDEIKIRPLIWSNISDISLIQNNNCSFYKNSYDYVSYHYYSRNKK